MSSLRWLVADAGWRPGLRVILDQRLVDWSRLSARDIERRVEVLARNAERMGDSRTAVVVAKDLAYGLLRMEQAEVEGKVPYEFAVFRSLDEARDWLRRAEDAPENPSRAAESGARSASRVP
jgi:hypothetical protein